MHKKREVAKKINRALKSRKKQPNSFSKILYSGLKIFFVVAFFIILYNLLRNSMAKPDFQTSNKPRSRLKKKHPQEKIAEAVHIIQKQEKLEAIKTSVKKLAAKTTIFCKPKFLKELKTRGKTGELSIELINRQIKQIRRLLPAHFNPIALQRILSQTDFKIVLLAANDAELTMNGKVAPDARYLPRSNRILICIDSDFTDKEVIQTLRNELHHALIRVTNRKLVLNKTQATDGYLALSPFLNSQGKKDNRKVTTLAQTIREGFAKIDELERLLKTKSSKLTSQQFRQRALYLSAFTDYQPKLHRIEMPMSLALEFLANGKKLSDGNILLKAKDMPPLIFYPPIIRGNSAVMKYIKAKSSSLVDLAHSFILDLRDELDNSENGGYADLTREDKLLEFSSSLQEIDGRVLKRFFPSWCRYFEDYTELHPYCIDYP